MADDTQPGPIAERLAANHIHADYWDVVSPLRIAQLRIADGHRVWGNDITPGSDAHRLLNDLERRAENQGDYRTDGLLGSDQDALLLDTADAILLAVCLHEAIDTANHDRMPRCAERMTELLHEVDSGRSPLILVVGTCRACWPNSRSANFDNGRHLVDLLEEASIAGQLQAAQRADAVTTDDRHDVNPHTATFNALED